ncbi:5-oxoprolinase/urea amidolyase family protein [Pedobacter sp. HMF7056]|uniref:5-oxoprolinase/urea amidolyase family protein n=2 Tax=Hufsiella ginkgonis TaxID=2695274 RepID=A0A7K1Y224_9SPHI|nr:5-oxoprolinase/urea amidolyase family protein [Hufsiella ginkgonis]
MRIKIINPGILSTIQDQGRFGYLSQAVPVSGAMDKLAAQVANAAVGNNAGDAVIEFTYAGASFTAETDVLIAYSGSGGTFICNNRLVPAGRPVFIPAGRSVQLMNDPSCRRIFLAITGGWKVPPVLGSRSTYLPAALGGYQGRRLKAGDILESEGECTEISRKILRRFSGTRLNYPGWHIARQQFVNGRANRIRVIASREYDWFKESSLRTFLSKPYVIGLRSNRMGYFLDGPVLEKLQPGELLSTAVTPGTIQVSNDGTPVLLMADCQTTGGYPRIAAVASIDLSFCGQLYPGDTIYFTLISRREAEILYLERQKSLDQLRASVEYKFS